MHKEIPIFFSTDDAYVPYLDVAIASLIANASKDYTYRIVILHTGLKTENMETLKLRARDGFVIDCVDISEALKDIQSHFKDVYHFSVVTYYRLFIASLFPQYEKIVYLDCDLVVLGDIAALYHTELGENILGVVADAHVRNTPAFKAYAENAIGVAPDAYFNAGVLLINLTAFRQHKIKEKCIRLMTAYDFDLLDPDQAYLNFLCRDKKRLLASSWNSVPTSVPCDGEKNIVHYALYKKPWQYDDVTDGEYFWHYAKTSPFYAAILKNRAAFTAQERAEKETAAIEIVEHAKAIVASDNTFVKKLIRR